MTVERPALRVAPITRGELDQVCAGLAGRSRAVHESRLLDQERGDGPYLIAWSGDDPVAHVALILPSDRWPDLSIERRGTPVVEDLWVEPSARGRGVGRALMSTLEDAARAAGHRTIQLDAGVDAWYGRARRLYRAAGWGEVPRSLHIESAAIPQDDGAAARFVEIVTTWRKPDLGAASWTVRRLSSGDLEALARDLPAWNAHEYRDRLVAQERGEMVQLAAWDGARALGKAMVLFPGHEEYSVSAEREGCAEVRDVEVVEDARRRGIGTAMIRRLEDATRERGMARIGMSVAIGAGAGPAELVYGKLGYVRAHGPFISSTDLRDDDGGPIPVGAVMAYLAKELV